MHELTDACLWHLPTEYLQAWWPTNHQHTPAAAASGHNTRVSKQVFSITDVVAQVLQHQRCCPLPGTRENQEALHQPSVAEGDGPGGATNSLLNSSRTLRWPTATCVYRSGVLNGLLGHET